MQIKTETKVGAFVIFALIILAYMALNLGVFKWHLNRHHSYIVLFNNVTGLTKKAEVKIAGVKVGWVEQIRLTEHGQTAEVVMLIDEEFYLFADAKVEIAQEGLLGNKFLAVRPGLPTEAQLKPGSCLPLRGQESKSIEDLIAKFDQVAQNIDQFVAQVAPASVGINQAVKKLDLLLEQDFNKIISGVDNTLGVMNSIAQKVDNGQGALGKILNEPDLYDQVQLATSRLRRVSQVCDDMSLVVDSHFEAMFRNCDANYCHKQSKGYLDFWANFNRDYFGLFELVWSECGGVTNREEFLTAYFNQKNQPLSPTQLSDLGCAYSIVPPLTKETVVKRDLFLYGVQAGRWFGNLAFRAGLMESYFGLALDYDLPFTNENWQWITTLEFFDFKGQSRLCDRRPHFKWLNEIYFRKNLYLAFGIDDFISKNNLNPFLGIGLSFGGD